MSQSNLLERDAELTRLVEALAKTQFGNRQICFITGAAGVGKTALVHSFLNSQPGIRFGVGRCHPHPGDRKPYRPILEALGSPDIGGFGASRERMLLEICRAIETPAQTHPYLLVIEDLHWADLSTLDVIRKLASRRDPARLLFLLTLDPVDVILSGHPLKILKQELLGRRLAWELPVDELSVEAAGMLLRRKSVNASVDFSQKAYEIAGGNPTFLTALAGFADSNPGQALPRSLRKLTGTSMSYQSESVEDLIHMSEDCIRLGAHAEAASLLARAASLADHLCDSKLKLAVHQQLAALHRAGGQLEKAAAEYEILASAAKQEDDIGMQARSKLLLAEVTAWFDRTRCLKACDEAATLVEHIEAPLVRADILGQAAYWNLIFRGWSAVDAQDSANAVNAARQAHDDEMLAFHACRHSLFQALRGEYREAYLTAEEGLAVAFNTRRYHDYSIGQYFYCWALLHSGRWDDLRVALDRALELSTQNRHDQWIVFYRLIDAWLQIQKGNFSQARSIAEDALARSRRTRLAFGQQAAMILSGFAELGLGNLEFARDHFIAVSDWQARERVAMDWILRLPLQLGMVDLHLAYGDLEGARAEADLFQHAAAPTAEPTWKALAHLAMARVAIASGEMALARREVREGCLQVERRDAPLAQGPLHELAESLDFPCFDPVAWQTP